MKKQILLGITLAALGATAALAQDQAQQLPPMVGRYQAIDATFINQPDAAEKHIKRMVIIDTVYGVPVSVCEYGYANGGKMQDGTEYWTTGRGCTPWATNYYPTPKLPLKK
jgi:hypothetical protein